MIRSYGVAEWGMSWMRLETAVLELLWKEKISLCYSRWFSGFDRARLWLKVLGPLLFALLSAIGSVFPRRPLPLESYPRYPQHNWMFFNVEPFRC